MANRIAVVICPACGQACYELDTGKLSEHETGNYVVGERSGVHRRARCQFSGGTWLDASERITPWQRLRMNPPQPRVSQ